MARSNASRTDEAQFIENPAALRELIECLQQEGKTVVLANGAFDLLHVGHVRCLRDAKSRGDFLVVALNTDASIKKYKDAKRPIHPLADRVEMLQAMRFVDYVVPFAEPTCDELIATLRPDVVAKGTDYTEETVPERETILSYGGRIAIVGDPKDHASTAIIKKIRRMKS